MRGWRWWAVVSVAVVLCTAGALTGLWLLFAASLLVALAAAVFASEPW